MTNFPEIRNQLRSRDLFEDFKKQMLKDFQQAQFATAFIDKLVPDYASIHHRIQLELQHTETDSAAAWMPLLNRIDISESQLKRYLNENNDRPYADVVAELIIKRLVQKVVIRHHYRNGPQTSEERDQ